MSLDGRFRYAELIDAIADNLLRLSDGVLGLLLFHPLGLNLEDQMNTTLQVQPEVERTLVHIDQLLGSIQVHRRTLFIRQPVIIQAR